MERSKRIYFWLSELLSEIGESLDHEDLHHSSYFLGRAVEKTAIFVKRLRIEKDEDEKD